MVILCTTKGRHSPKSNRPKLSFHILPKDNRAKWFTHTPSNKDNKNSFMCSLQFKLEHFQIYWFCQHFGASIQIYLDCPQVHAKISSSVQRGCKRYLLLYRKQFIFIKVTGCLPVFHSRRVPL